MATQIKFTSTAIEYAVTNVDTETTYTLDTPLIVTVVAENGYYFDTPPYIFYENEIGEGVRARMSTDEAGEYPSSFYFVIDENFISSNWVDVYKGVAEMSVGGLATRVPKLDKYGIITLYNPTPAELKQIGAVRYYSGDQAVDLGNYISSLIKVFVKVPQGDKTEVLLGGYGTNVECNVIDSDIVETDCGTIEIVGRYNNSMDYENTTVEIYLPLVGFQELETEKVMNETLSLIYKTNLVNGDSIACIYNTTGTLIYTFNCKASFEIPYMLNAYDNKGDVRVDSNYLFGFTPTVTIRYNKAYNASHAVGNDNQETTLDRLQGFVKCSEVFNTINATTTEKDEIDTLLKSGVIIT